MLATGSLVVLIGFVTMGAMQAIVTQALGKELDQKGLTAARVLANDLANPLLDGDDLVVQRNLNRFSNEGPSVAYAYVVSPDRRKLIHTFADGVPEALYTETALNRSTTPQVRFLLTEQGRIRDYGVRILDGLDAELHIGLAEEGILVTNRRVMSLIVGLTVTGVTLAVLLAWVLGRYVVRPLEYLTATAEEIGEGRLDKEISIVSPDEVGDLADSFNRMLARLREAMGREQKRNRELTALNAVSRVVSLGDDLSVVLTQGLQELVEALGLTGGWIMLLGEGQALAGEVAAAVGVEPDEITRCLRNERPCSCWSAVQSGDPPGRSDRLLIDCPMTTSPGENLRIVGPIPLVAGGKMLGFLNVVLAPDQPLDDQTFDMLVGIGRQLGAALEQALLWHKLRDREERVSQLLQKVINAQEEEQKRIARELHDETSQSMAALAVGLKAAASLVHRNPDRAESMLESLKETTAHTLHEIHNIVYDLRPTVLDDRGLVPALHWCATQRLGPQGVAIDIAQGGIKRRLPPQVETTLFRIGQEAITNVAKHANAHNVRILVQTEESHVRLSVADDGCGFLEESENGERRDQRPLGLVGMTERAKLLGGHVQVNSVPGEGTRIDVVIPLEEGREHDSHPVGR